MICFKIYAKEKYPMMFILNIKLDGVIGKIDIIILKINSIHYQVLAALDLNSNA